MSPDSKRHPFTAETTQWTPDENFRMDPGAPDSGAAADAASGTMSWRGYLTLVEARLTASS